MIGVALLAGLPAFAFYTGDRVTVDEVQEMINSELSVGANAEEIEAFFEKRGIGFSYDTFRDRYDSIYRNVSRYTFIDKAVVVHVYVDSEKKFTRSSSYLSYTFL